MTPVDYDNTATREAGDRKWVVFRLNMFGPAYVFAVEIEKTLAS